MRIWDGLLGGRGYSLCMVVCLKGGRCGVVCFEWWVVQEVCGVV
jgi:hypothetical protein